MISNIEKKPDFYSRAVLPFHVKESENIFKYYKEHGYDFEGKGGSNNVLTNVEGLFDLFLAFGKAKHEPCGEHWDVTFGESAWRLAVMALCLPSDLDRKRIVKMALTSSFTRSEQD